jgi:hypothetical protein
LNKSAEAGPIRLALDIEDRVLAERLASLFANVPGLQVVGAGEAADVTMVLSNGVSSAADDEVLLTPRELEVLTLLAEGLSNKGDSSPSWHICSHRQVPCRCTNRQTRCGWAHRRRRTCSASWRYSSLAQVLAVNATNIGRQACGEKHS